MYTVHLRFRNGFGLLMKDTFCFLELKLCLVLVYGIKGFITSKTGKRRSLIEYRFLFLGVAC
jgi:hypothetical protein